MNKVNAFKVSLIISIVLNLLGAFFKIAHYPFGNLLIWISTGVSLVFIILGLLDVFKDKEDLPVDKLLWTLGLIFLNWVAGLLYYPKFKRRNQ
jgi:hypothetical protein